MKTKVGKLRARQIAHARACEIAFEKARTGRCTSAAATLLLCAKDTGYGQEWKHVRSTVKHLCPRTPLDLPLSGARRKRRRR